MHEMSEAFLHVLRTVGELTLSTEIINDKLCAKEFRQEVKILLGLRENVLARILCWIYLGILNSYMGICYHLSTYFLLLSFLITIFLKAKLYEWIRKLIGKYVVCQDRSRWKMWCSLHFYLDNRIMLLYRVTSHK